MACTFPSTAGEGQPFDLKEYTTSIIEAVDTELKRIIPLGRPEKIHEAMTYSLLGGGKRSCPTMCIAASDLLGGSRDRSLPVACALEMIHTASLMRDDLPCMDNDPLRRGRPSCHVMFGEHVAILAGDALFALALEYVIEATDLPAERVLKTLYEIGKAVGSKGMVGGQYMDLVSGGSSSRLEAAAVVEYIHLHKSALMAEISVVGGGIVGGGSDDEVERMRAYGKAVGLAYQIVDDMLDEVRTTEELGKTAGKDRKAEKATYPKVYGMEKCREMVEDLKSEACRCLCGFDEKKAAPLVGFAEYVVTRSS